MATLSLDWIELAAIIGAIQGIILAGVLATQRTNRTANRLLACLLATFTIYLAAGPYYRSGLIRVHPHLFASHWPTLWLFGPLVYLYSRAASDRSWRLGRESLVHGVPPAIAVAVMIPVYSLTGAEKIATFERWSAHGVDGFLAYIDPLKYVSGIAYSAATILYLVRHGRDVERSYSNIARVNLRWLLWFASATGCIWLMVVVLRIAHASLAIRDAQVAITMALVVYGIGYAGLSQPEIIKYGSLEVGGDSETGRRSTSDNVTASDRRPTTHDRRYERSGLGDAEARQLRQSMLDVMDREQLWKESELTLADLAQRIHSTPQHLSQVLNAQMGQTFYDFVNGYRVREVQRRIRAGDARTFKMVALAMDAGFASKSTFNDAFKKHTSQTPSAFRLEHGTSR